MHIGVATDVGRMRDHNEDAYFFTESLFVVCDGMGGHQAGEVASALAIEVLGDFSLSDDNPHQQIETAIGQAHRRIVQEAHKRGLYGMGTTITMGVLHGSNEDQYLYLGHVGDSRAYLMRQGNLVQLTQDHSVAAELLRNGSLTESEADIHPHRHVLTQALGVGEIEVDTDSLKVNRHDILVICSDGLTNVVLETSIRDVLAQHNPQEAADTLVHLANENGGPDNITVLVVHLG